MRVLALTETASADNPVVHDLDLRAGHLWFRDDEDDEGEADATAQALRSDLQFFLGEWFLDQREGVPYYRDVFVRNPSIPLISSIFRDVILRRKRISHLTTFRLDLDAASRTLSLTFEAVSITGAVIDYVTEPLVLELP